MNDLNKGEKMEAYKEVFGEKILETNKDNKETVDQKFTIWYMKYPQKQLSDAYFMEIINQEDSEKREQLIDKLIDLASEDSFETGFFTKEQEIDVGGFGGHSFYIDDNEIYYLFFDKVINVINELKKEDQSIADKMKKIIAKAIKLTEIEYFGVGNQSRSNRLKLLAKVYDKETDSFPVPSIKVMKGKGVAECVEFASVAHNLWTLAGVKSYYISSKDCFFHGVDQQYGNDGHAFDVVFYDGSYKVFDMALGNFGIVVGDPIKDFKEDKPVVLEGKGVRVKGIYGNYSKFKESDEKLK